MTTTTAVTNVMHSLNRHGVDYEGSDNSELLEYWAVCGSY